MATRRSSSPEQIEATQVFGEAVFQTDPPFPVRLVPHWLTANGPWREHIAGE